MDGVLIVAKPAGPTSHDIVGLIRRLTVTRRVGHGGTLDPFASGVLPVFLGKATRLVEYHLAADKRYRATICFGARSTTDDLEGELTPVDGPPVERAAVESALAGMAGSQLQRPPDFSAVKVRGRRAYAMARRGERPELRPREVTIHAIDLLEWDAVEPARPIAVVEVRCSAGTYVRAIARDLGAAVGSAAYLGALVRTASGSFRIEDARTPDEIRAAAMDGPARIERLLRPLDSGLDDLPEVTLDERSIKAIVRGSVATAPAGLAAGEPVRIRDADGRLVAIGRRIDGAIRPLKVLVDPTDA
jgi:tRNA pseudouridine55 synthase